MRSGTITVRPKLSRQQLGGAPPRGTNVSRTASPGEAITLSWHREVYPGTGVLAYVWTHIGLASSVHVRGGRPWQRTKVVMYLRLRGVAVTLPEPRSRAQRDARRAGASSPGSTAVER
jgi:hypothetical protein